MLYALGSRTIIIITSEIQLPDIAPTPLLAIAPENTPDMSSQLSSADFIQSVEKLDPTGSNFIIFKRRFGIAVKSRDLWNHFDGTSPKPSLSNPPNADETIALSAWEKKENTAMHLLAQKLPDSTLTKLLQCKTVALMWQNLIAEFSTISLFMKSDMRTKFMELHYRPGANLTTEFDRI